jgi:Transposase
MIERPGALDVHKEQVTACVRVPANGRKREQHVAEFNTTGQGVLACRDWFKAHGVTHVAMEATGVYWTPVWSILEDHTRKGSKWLSIALTESAQSNTRTKDTYLAANTGGSSHVAATTKRRVRPSSTRSQWSFSTGSIWV